MADLRALAERYVHLTSEIESVRREMLVCLSNGIGPDAAGAPGQAASAKRNGHDPRPPVPTPAPKAAPTPRPTASKSGTAKRDNPAHARAAERRLLAAMRDHPGASVEKLAEAAGAGRSTCGERLRRLAAQELIEKDANGHWRVKAEEPRPSAPREEPRPTMASPS